MSTHDAPQNDPHGHQSEDHIDFQKVILVGVVSLIIFALGIWWAAGILRHETKRAEDTTGLAADPALIGKPEIGIVDQVPFNGDHRLADWRRERSSRLNSYGWVDRAKGIVHVPIERAMDATLAGSLPEGAPR
jgi:hypothetical protein